MKLQFVNPLEYPLAVIAGAIILFVGGRFAKQPPWLMVPIAVVVTTGGAYFLQSRQPEKFHFNDPVLEREILQVKQSALVLADRAESLRQEAASFLVDASQMDLLVAVQYACDRTLELPTRIDDIARRMGNTKSLLAVGDLQKQLDRVAEQERAAVSIAGKKQFQLLEQSLRQNIELAKEGQDSRHIQVATLTHWVTESAGILQKMQNKIRTISVSNSEGISELQELSTQLNSYQENVNLLMFN